MKVVLTGATGLVGGGVLTALLAAGHEVTALVRSESSAKVATDVGATAAQGDLSDVDWVRSQLADAEGAVHTASPGAGGRSAADVRACGRGSGAAPPAGWRR